MINDFFAYFYEIKPLFQNVYSVKLWEMGIYSKLGYLLIGIPLVLTAVFYLLWKYPFAKLWHWLIWWLIAGTFVSLFSYQIIAAQQQFAIYLNDPSQFPDCRSFVNKIVIANGFYSLIIGFLYSLVLKRIPKPQSHLPFTIKRK